MTEMHEVTNRHGPACGSIMVAVNGGASGWRALNWAAAESSARHSVLRIVHAIDWPRWGLDPLGSPALDWCSSQAPEQGKLILDEAARRARLAGPHATITTHLEAGNAVAAILQAGRSDALIVIGRSRTRRPGWRSASRRVVRRARMPVVVVELLDEGTGPTAPIPGVTVRRRSVEGPQGPALAAETAPTATLLVIRSGARRRLHHALTASVARSVYQHAQCAMAIAWTPATSKPGGGRS